MRIRTIDQFTVGDHAEITCRIDAGTVASFVTLSGDRNPIHRDVECAVSTSCREPIAPGLSDTITARVVVTETLPGRNRVRLSTECVNAAGERLLSGEAWVMPAVVAEAVPLPLAA